MASNEGKSSKPKPLQDANRVLSSGAPAQPQSPLGTERDEDESETGESEVEDMGDDGDEGQEGNNGNKRKRGGDSLTVDDDEASEIESEQEEVQVC